MLPAHSRQGFGDRLNWHIWLWGSVCIEYTSLRRTGCSDLGVLWLSNARSSHGDPLPLSSPQHRSITVLPRCSCFHSVANVVDRKVFWRRWTKGCVPCCSPPHRIEILTSMIFAKTERRRFPRACDDHHLIHCCVFSDTTRGSSSCLLDSHDLDVIFLCRYHIFIHLGIIAWASWLNHHFLSPRVLQQPFWIVHFCWSCS